ncbi:MAG: purine-nucleoside phosphorylase [Aliifodinibius sp.]|nr:purine-nucleoside phosphorylase [Fodinibius sp.]
MTIEMIEKVANQVQEKTKHSPKIGLILGSGLGELAESVENADRIPYSEIDGWPISTVVGHSGRLVIGELEGKTVLVMQGRVHYYEGYDMSLIGLPIRVMKRMGVESLILTNAAGAINPKFEPGDIMMLIDHLNLIGMTGQSPLRGPNLDEFGTRFPDMSRVYDRDFQKIARKVALENNIYLQEGVYVCLAGPSFETPADLRFLGAVGVDAVGMSTVPEATVARHSGIRVFGLSGITNKANLDGSTVTTHEEVFETGKLLVPKIMTVVKGVLKEM